MKITILGFNNEESNNCGECCFKVRLVGTKDDLKSAFRF